MTLSGLAGTFELGAQRTLGCARTCMAAAGAAQHERNAHREHGTEKWPGDVHPVAGPVIADEVLTERASRVHRRSRDGAAPQTGQRDVATDAEGADDAD